MQSKKSSINEVLLNTGSGFIVSLTVTKALYPVLNILSPVTITLIYTVVSIIRSYIWRRLFNRKATSQIVNQS
jgi:antibiotic biosynthesis monooxygenase (ABM) superfamily enzyme